MKAILVFLLSIFVSFTIAQENSNRAHPFSGAFVISGEGGITIGGTDFQDVKMDFAGRGSLEYYLPTRSPSAFGIKLLAGGGYIAGTGLNNPNPIYANIDEFQTKIIYGGGGIVYSYSLGKVVQPYLFAGVSYMIFDPFKTDGTKMPRNAAGEYPTDDKDYMGEFGIRFLISNHVSLNASYTFNYLINDNIDDVWNSNEDAFHSISGGLSYYFLPSGDIDGDGVKDSKDLCESTPKGVKVDEFGCALDSDNDKVPDYLDLCSETPDNVNVDENGCPIDSDKDGIADYLDKCPDSKMGADVDIYGCEKILKVAAPKPQEVEEVKEVEKVKEVIKIKEDNLLLVLSGSANFKFGESTLLPNPKSGLDKMSEYMKKNRELKWIIEGHTDNVGNEITNMSLSLARAKAVKKYLVSKGIDDDRFKIMGSGSTKPAADNSVEFGRTLNRRVTIEEEKSYLKKMKIMKAVDYDNYDSSKEYNKESLIFTDGKYYCIQVSSWKTKTKAANEVIKLVMAGHKAFVSEAKDAIQGQTWYRVRIGYFDNLEGTREYLKMIR